MVRVGAKFLIKNSVLGDVTDQKMIQASFLCNLYSKRVSTYGEGPYPRTSPWLAAGLQSILHLVRTLLDDNKLTIGDNIMAELTDGIDMMLSASLNETLSKIRSECKQLFTICVEIRVGSSVGKAPSYQSKDTSSNLNRSLESQIGGESPEPKENPFFWSILRNVKIPFYACYV